jgi:alanyl-tRNA synthetase
MCCAGSCGGRCGYGRRLGLEKPFLHWLAPAVVEGFSGVYFEPSAVPGVSRSVAGVLKPEEERFGKTLSEGADRVGEAIERLRREGATALSGDTVFRFYDTYGIPLEVIEEIAGDEGVAVDRAGFEEALERQRETSRASAKFGAADVSVYERLELPSPQSVFRGYPELDFVSLSGAKVLAIVQGRARDLEARRGRDRRRRRGPHGLLSGRRRPGRRQGSVEVDGGEAEVTDVQKPVPGVIAHRVTVRRGHLGVGASIDMEVPEWTRRKTQAQPHGDPPAARGPAQGARAVGSSDGLAGGAGAAAVRLCRERASDRPARSPRSSGWSTRRSCATGS